MDQLQNIILTGIPRSGTSLACTILDQLNNVVVLQEPMDVATFGNMTGWLEIKQYIKDFFSEMRNSALTYGTVLSQNQNGKIVDNYYQDPNESNGKIRGRQTNNGIIKVKKNLTSNLKMIIKHNAAFTALIPNLTLEFPTFAVVRHPLWALASWNSNNLPIFDGHIPMAEQLDHKLASDLATIANRLDRQIHILSWMFEKFSLLNTQNIIYYEAIIDTCGKELSKILPAASSISENLSNNNFSERYPQVPLNDLEKRLRQKGGAYFDFYTWT